MSSQFSSSKEQPVGRRVLPDPPSTAAPGPASRTVRHDRVSRLNSSGPADGLKDRSSDSYAERRENRLAARRAEQAAAGSGNYKKMYEEALLTNERLKTRLEGSKQELVMMQTQLERANQRKGRGVESCRSNIQLETEKKERRALERKISDMEEEIKVQTDLKMENQRLKDENGALIRVISKLSK
ncbi:protein phosphatase 1 regulatory subunit 12B-like [Osmerus mordax]|uniref:protein phosphatase 1 regulatory subunit 12B-like n=1 Tax=Osmerus mordax TaxID=8014 RepID=UPI00351041AA